MNTLLKKLIFACVLGLIFGLILQNIITGVSLFAAAFAAFCIPIYMRYAKDNPKGFWFKRKLFGWGWTPVTWQGWLAIAIYLGLIFTFALTIDESSPTREVAFTFLIPSIFFTILLIRIAYKTGEKPKWQWGEDLKKYE